jgi:hypothetical protein
MQQKSLILVIHYSSDFATIVASTPVGSARTEKAVTRISPQGVALSTPSRAAEPFMDRLALNVAGGGSIATRFWRAVTALSDRAAELVSRSSTAGGEIRLFSVTKDRIVGRLTLGLTAKFIEYSLPSVLMKLLEEKKQ